MLLMGIRRDPIYNHSGQANRQIAAQSISVKGTMRRLFERFVTWATYGKYDVPLHDQALLIELLLSHAITSVRDEPSLNRPCARKATL